MNKEDKRKSGIDNLTKAPKNSILKKPDMEIINQEIQESSQKFDDVEESEF